MKNEIKCVSPKYLVLEQKWMVRQLVEEIVTRGTAFSHFGASGIQRYTYGVPASLCHLYIKG